MFNVTFSPSCQRINSQIFIKKGEYRVFKIFGNPVHGMFAGVYHTEVELEERKQWVTGEEIQVIPTIAKDKQEFFCCHYYIGNGKQIDPRFTSEYVDAEQFPVVEAKQNIVVIKGFGSQTTYLIPKGQKFIIVTTKNG